MFYLRASVCICGHMRFLHGLPRARLRIPTTRTARHLFFIPVHSCSFVAKEFVLNFSEHLKASERYASCFELPFFDPDENFPATLKARSILLFLSP
jgi:hypothetical protein